MKEILKTLGVKRKMKTKEIYSLLKTNSRKINSEISKIIKSFSKIDDFFNYYSNQTSLFELLNKLEFNASKNYDEIFSSFDSNIEQYIFCVTQIIISIKLILRAQKILNKIFLSSKQCLSKLKIEQQIENISQKKLFSFIGNLLDNPRAKTSKNYSSSFSKIKFESSDSINNNLLYHQNFNTRQSLKPFSNIDIEKTLKIIYEEPCTPKFGSNLDQTYENAEKVNCQNIHVKKDSSLTLSGEHAIKSLDNKTIVKDIKNDYISKKIVNNNMNEKKYEKLLEMINNIYKKCIINSEEKIKLKQLVIAKSKKLENLYYNICKNKFKDENFLRTEITKFIN